MGPDSLVRQGAQAQVPNQQCAQRGAGGQSQLQTSLGCGQRCIIPAANFDEPNWESGKNVWWRFKRTDGAPWGLAGLWNVWTDKATGEQHDSYTMLTVNADQHPLMRRMHKPDPKLPVDAHDMRSVIPIEAEDVDVWLAGTTREASRLLRLPFVEEFDAGPAALPIVSFEH